MNNIEDWLNQLGLGQYVERMAENFVDMSVLPDLSEHDLATLGIPLGHRKKMLRAISELEGAQPANAIPVRVDESERRQLTVMFCDLVGSTALAGRLDPEDMRDVIAAYQDACAGATRIYDGFISQYLGDGILVYFGYPRAHEDDAERAVRAALEIISSVSQLATRADEPLRVRVGIATGLVVVGEVIGEGRAQQQMAVGPTPNLAARLQALAEPGSIIVADSTRRLLGETFALRAMPSQLLKGIAEPVSPWVVEAVSDAASRFDAARAARLTAFVCRENEVGILLERQELAWRGSGQAILVSGEAGIGKSRLLGWLGDRLAGQQHIRLRYQCSPYHSNSALYPFIRQIETAAAFAPEDTPERRLDKLESLVATTLRQSENVVPLLAALCSIPVGERYPPLGLSPAQQRRQTFEAFLDQLDGLACLGPVLMMFEDIHWADATSLELVDLVIERIRKLPALLVMTHRPEISPAWTSLENVRVVELGRLEQSCVGEMVESVTGGRALPAEVMEQILVKTDGVPLFVEELTRAVQEAGILVQENDHYRLEGPLPPFAIPATLHDSLMARLDRLSAAKEVAQVGAAIGRQFSYALIKTVMARDSADLRTALAQLERADLIVSRGPASDPVYQFKHALVQDTAYESLLRSRRQVVHHRIAEAIREQFAALADTQPEIVAYHYSQAGLADLAIEWWAKASEWARAHSAYAEAVAHLAKALGLAGELANTPESRALHLKVQLRYGRTLLAAKGWAGAEVTAAFTRAKELAAEVDDVQQRVAIDFALWYCNFTQGAPIPIGPISEAFLATVKGAPAQRHNLELATLVKFFMFWFSGDFIQARRYCEARFRELNAATQPAAYSVDLNPHVTVRLYIALILWPLGDVELARQNKEEALALAIQKGDVATLANTLAHSCYFEGFCRNFSRAKEHGEALLGLSREHRLEGWMADAHFYVGLGQFHEGQHELGMNQMLGAGAQGASLGMGLWAPFNAALLAEAEARHLGADAGIARIDSALREIERSGLRWIEAELYRMRGDMLLAREGSTAEAIEAAFTRALAVARSQKARSMELRAATALARFYHAHERIRAARDVLAPALEGFNTEPAFSEGADANRLLGVLSSYPV